MSVAIRITDEVYNEARRVARAEYRTIPSQIEFWAIIGKCALENPDLPIEFIRDTLVSKKMDRSLAEPFKFEDKSGKNNR